MENDEIMCPLIDDTIEIGDCIVCSDVSSGMLKENAPQEVKEEFEAWMKEHNQPDKMVD